MAEHKIQGGDYLLKINDDTVVCLTSVSLSDSVTVVDAASACGPDKSPGALEISISFEGQHLQDPTTGKISGTDLRSLLRSESTISFELGPLLPKIGDEIQTGTGFISELSSTYAFDSVGTFTGTIQIYGMPTTTIFDVVIGQSYAGGYICYIDEGETYVIVASPVGDVYSPTSSDAYEWGAYGIDVGATNFFFGYGEYNTELIVAADNTPTIAAALCQAKGIGWYLPSPEDLIIGVGACASQMPFINPDLTDAQARTFWSSKQQNDYNARTIKQDGLVFTSYLNPIKTASNFVIAYKNVSII